MSASAGETTSVLVNRFDRKSLVNGHKETETEHLLPGDSNEINDSDTEQTDLAAKKLNLINAKSNIPYRNTVISDSKNYDRQETEISSSDIIEELSPSSSEESKREFVLQLISKSFEDKCKPEHQRGPDYIIPTNAISSTEPDSAVRLLTTSAGHSSEEPISVVTLFKRIVDSYPDHIALAVKRNGEWIRWTYSQYWNIVRTVAKGFIKLGLERFHAVGILGFNSPEWSFAALGTVFAGGLTAGIYTTNSPEACLHVLKDSRANIALVENEKQLQKILSIKSELPHLKAIIQYIGEPKEWGVLSWNDLLDIGNSVLDEVLERRIKGLAINQCCTLIYTSGTTGSPCGAMLSHDNVIFLAKQANLVSKQKLGDVFISYLPLSHVAAQVGDIYIPIACGGECHFATPDALKGQIVDTLKEVRPHYVFGVPRVWEKIAEKLKETESRLSYLKSIMFRFARFIALRYHESRTNDSERGSFLFWIARKLVLDKVRQALGLDRAIMIISGGAPLSPEVLKYFTSLNMFVNESYGMSESSGPNTSNQVYPYCFSSVGIPFPGISFRIDNPDEKSNGEICMKGRNVFMGYKDMKEKTEETLDEDGWMHTGDIGHLSEDNHLFITGRIKEIIITAGGENVAPVPIEDRVKKVLPIVSNCMLIGDKRKFLSILLTLKTKVDINTMNPQKKLLPVAIDWCRSVGSKANTVDDILDGPDEDVMDAIQEGIDHVNKRAISNAQRIQKWKILPQDFSIPGGELGPSMKLKRPFVSEKYSDIIDGFYEE